MYFRLYFEIGKQSMLQPVLFRKDLFELYNNYMAERKRKILGKNSKIYSRQFRFQNNIVKTEIVCYKFSNSSVFFWPYCRARKDLSDKVWVVALIAYRFRDKSENTKFRHLSAKQRTKVSSPGYKGVP